jgi:rhodanese-related sulfurtransferase
MKPAAAARSLCALRLAGACASLLALAAFLGVMVNHLRPPATRLPWVGDWAHHIETRAFQAGIPVVFLNGVRERLGDPAGMVFDARKPELYAAGHLPGARSLPVEEAAARLMAFAAVLTMKTPLLVYCDGADCGDSLELALKLREFGFTDVSIYPGGFAEWTAYGGAVRTGEAP